MPAQALVIRHTSTEDESGSRELLSSTTGGRIAPLPAALVAVFGAHLVLAAAVTVALLTFGLPTVGSLALGLSFAGAGWMCAAIGGVAALASEGAATARGISLLAFTVLFLPRIAGDAAGQDSDLAWLSWLSPLHWTRLTHPFADEKWWVLALVLGFTAVLAAAATRSARAATWTPASCGHVPDRRRPLRGCAARSPWHGGCTAAHCCPAPSGSRSSAAWRARSPRSPRSFWATRNRGATSSPSRAPPTSAKPSCR